MENPEQKGETSKYNEAALHILRLHNIWEDVRRARKAGDMVEYRWLLDDAWSELVAPVNRLQDEKTVTEAEEETNSELENAKGRSKIYLALRNRHHFLKKTQDKVGMGGVYTDGSDEDFI